jgi:hypothetical protein
MKYTVFNKKSEEKKEVSFEDLQKIGNAFAIKANIDSKRVLELIRKPASTIKTNSRCNQTKRRTL